MKKLILLAIMPLSIAWTQAVSPFYKAAVAAPPATPVVIESADSLLVNFDDPTFSVTVGSNANRALIVGVVADKASVIATVSSDVDGPFTNFCTRTTTTGDQDISLWYITGVTSGSHTVTIDFSTTGSGGAFLYELSNAHQTTPIRDTVSGVQEWGQTISATITSTANDICVDFMGGTQQSGTYTPDAGQTNDMHETGQYPYTFSSRETGAASVQMGWGWSSPETEMLQLIASLRPPS